MRSHSSVPSSPHASLPALIERDNQLGLLVDMAGRIGAGGGRIAIVGGEAGIGKTTLLEEFARQVADRCEVHWGWCEALFTPRALGPLQDMAGEIDPYLPGLLRDSASQDRIFPALLNALQDATKPRVLIFEDVHWADHATLDLLKFLGRRIVLLPVMLVLSARTDEILAGHPIFRILGDLPTALTQRVRLEPLSLDGVAGLAASSGLPAADLFRITAGNPFFVTELITNHPTAGEKVPESVRDAVWSRLARLTPLQRELLETMSIAPGGVELWLVNALLENADATIDECVARQFIIRDNEETLRFRHVLARQATLDSLPPAAQRTLHARVGAAMTVQVERGVAVSLARRVHHASGAGDAAKVLELAPLAAAELAKLGAHQQAAAHLAIALKYVDQAPKELAAQLYESWAYEAGVALRIDEFDHCRPPPRHRNLARGGETRKGWPQPQVGGASPLVSWRDAAG